MKYCQNCGKRISQNTVFCPYCGMKQKVVRNQKITNNNKSYSSCWLWLIIGYVLPLALGTCYSFIWLTVKHLRGTTTAIGVNGFNSLFVIIAGLIQFIISIVFIIKFRNQHLSIKYASVILFIISLLSITYNIIFIIKLFLFLK